MKKILFLCCFALLFAGNHYAFSQDNTNNVGTVDVPHLKALGGQAIGNNDFQGAIPFFLSAYQQGDLNSTFWMAWCYSKLNNWSMAAKYRAVMVDSNNTDDANYYDCVTDLSEMYMQGHGVPKNYEKAIELAKKAAIKGRRGGMNILGDIFSDKNFSRKNYQSALEWYMRAASSDNMSGSPNDAPNVIAMVTIGEFYEQGTGVKKDLFKALGWYRKALAEKTRQERFTGTDGKEYGRDYVISPSIEDHIKTAEEKLQKSN